MQQDPSSIFDQDFIQGTQLRRRELMPVGLKVLVWLFLVFTAISFTIRFCFYIKYQSAIDTGFLTGLGSFFSFSDFFPILLILANIFIILEMKHAILFTLIVAGIGILIDCYSLINVLSLKLPFSVAIISIVRAVLEIFYIVMLLRIKKAWETKAISGRELRAINNNS